MNGPTRYLTWRFDNQRRDYYFSSSVAHCSGLKKKARSPALPLRPEIPGMTLNTLHSISFLIYRTKVEASTLKRAVTHELQSFGMPNPEEVAPSQMAGNNIQYVLAVP